MKRGLLEGAPPGAVVFCFPSGWIHTDIWLGGWNTLCSVWSPRENISFSCCWMDIFTHTQKASLQWVMPVKTGLWSCTSPRTVGIRCSRMTWGSYGPLANPAIEIKRHNSGTIQRGCFHSCVSARFAFKPTLIQRHWKQKFLHFSKQEFIPAPPSCRTTPCRLSATANSIYSHLPSLLEAVPPSANWGCAMLWWEGPTYSG
jgi:hypothetical protein